ncbi:MAG: serine hydrolase [Candidatus Eisenbacteria bacterium]
MQINPVVMATVDTVTTLISRPRPSLAGSTHRALSFLLCLLIAIPFIPAVAWAGAMRVAAGVTEAVGGKKATPKKKAARKSTTKKSSTKQTSSKRSTSKKSSVRKSASKKGAKSSTSKKSTGKKSATKKATSKKSSIRRSAKGGTRSGKATLKSRHSRSTNRARSATRGKRGRGRAPRVVNTGAIDFAAAIVIEPETGAVLYERDPDTPRAPASLTKMMTELLALEALDRGEASLSDTVTVPYDVAYVGGTKAHLRPGERVTFEDLLHAMVIASCNDAALTVAIELAGSESGFVGRMNRRAGELGMRNTRYVNPHGLDRGEDTRTTARDQAILARALLEHREALAISSLGSDVIRSGQVVRNTNRLLSAYPGCDGLKTGYTSRAGYCLCSTAKRDDLRLVSVVLGSPSSARRFNESMKLLDDAFSRYERVKVFGKGDDLGQSLHVPGATPSEVALVAGGDVGVVVKAGESSAVHYRVDAPLTATAPLPAGAPIGTIEVMVGDSVAVRAPAVAARTARIPRSLTASESTN